MKHKKAFFIKAGIGCVLAVIVLLLVFFGGRCIYLQQKYPNVEGCFSFSEYSEIFLLTSSRDKDTAAPILVQANAAFHFKGTQKSAQARYAVLGRYSICTDEHPGTETEQHRIELVAAKFSANTGYVWVGYYQAGYDINGKITAGSGGQTDLILSKWIVKKDNGAWIVTDVYEAP